jgi:hypothetical protein
MGWETRRGKQYYYRATKINGRVVKTYVGTGEVGEAAERADEIARTGRAREADARRAHREHLAEGTRLVVAVYELGREVAKSILRGKGDPVARKNWRKKRGKGSVGLCEAADILERAAAEDARAADLAARRAALDAPPPPPPPPPAPAPVPSPAATAPAPAGGPVPPIAPRRARDGDLTGRAYDWIIGEIAGDDEAQRAAIRTRAALMHDEIVGPRPTDDIRLVAETVVVQWLHVYRLEAECARRALASGRARTSQSELTAAQRRYLSAFEYLIRVKNRQLDRDHRVLGDDL